MFFSSRPQLVECVPNFSEGRRSDVIEKIAEAIRKIPEAKLLDYSADYDHNRSVFTILGTPRGVFQAAYDSAELAIELIDVSHHEGVHPAMGAVDVIPFIPVQGVSMKAAVVLAQKLGYELETHLHLPSYYYAEAADEKQFRNLANLRKESYNLKKHKTVGCVCIGARDYLVACNANLETSDLNEAKRFAKAVRESSGGIAHLKAIGLSLPSKNKTQLSMCITNPKRLDWPKLQNLLKQKSLDLGIPIANFELIGLLPGQVKKAAKEFLV
jgi:glutamate formiminotransferase